MLIGLTFKIIIFHMMLSHYEEHLIYTHHRGHHQTDN